MHKDGGKNAAWDGGQQEALLRVSDGEIALPHSSMRKSTEPIEKTPSTNSRPATG